MRFFIAALLVPGLAYAENPSADLSVQIVPAGPQVPAGAQAAGFTTLAANYDFSQPKYASQSNYLTCGVLSSNAGSVTTDFWQEVDGNGLSTMPCDINQITDTGPNGDGSTVLELGWQPGYTGGGLPGLQQMHTRTIFPINSYVEIMGRVQDTPDITTYPYEDPGNYTLLWAWNSPGFEPDVNENFGPSNWPPGGVGQGNANTAAMMHQWPSQAVVALWQAQFDVRQYHKFGLRLTGNSSDGGTQAFCMDYDGVRTSCNTLGIPTGASAIRYNWLLTDGAICNSGTSQHSGGTGFGDFSCVVSRRIAYRVKYIRIWSCSSWQTGVCATGPITSNP